MNLKKKIIKKIKPQFKLYARFIFFFIKELIILSLKKRYFVDSKDKRNFNYIKKNSNFLRWHIKF